MGQQRWETFKNRVAVVEHFVAHIMRLSQPATRMIRHMQTPTFGRQHASCSTGRHRLGSQPGGLLNSRQCCVWGSRGSLGSSWQGSWQGSCRLTCTQYWCCRHQLLRHGSLQDLWLDHRQCYRSFLNWHLHIVSCGSFIWTCSRRSSQA